jgi:hypothetical protein
LDAVLGRLGKGRAKLNAKVNDAEYSSCDMGGIAQHGNVASPSGRKRDHAAPE